MAELSKAHNCNSILTKQQATADSHRLLPTLATLLRSHTYNHHGRPYARQSERNASSAGRLRPGLVETIDHGVSKSPLDKAHQRADFASWWPHRLTHTDRLFHKCSQLASAHTTTRLQLCDLSSATAAEQRGTSSCWTANVTSADHTTDTAVVLLPSKPSACTHRAYRQQVSAFSGYAFVVIEYTMQMGEPGVTR